MWKKLLYLCCLVLMSTPLQAAELSLNVATSPAIATVNQDLTYTFNISPISDSVGSAVNNVQLSYALPNSFKLQSVSSSIGICNGSQLIQCNLGRLENTLATVTLKLTPTEAGSVSSAVNVNGNAVKTDETGETDGDAVGTSSSLNTTIQAPQVSANDLSLTVSSTPTEATVGQPFTYNISLHAIQGQFQNVQLRYALPSQFELQAIVPSQGSCNDGNLIDCQLGALNENTLVRVTMTLVPQQQGSVNSNINVSALATDSQGIALGTTRTSAALNTTINAKPTVTLKFSKTTYEVAESAGVATITVLRNDEDKNFTRAVSIDYFTKAGSATAGSDYQETSGTLMWAEGDTDPKNFNIVVQNDTITEDDEVLSIGLRDPVDAEIEGDATVTLTITDDEKPGDIGFSAATFRGGEKDKYITISVLRSGGSDGEVNVDYTTIDGSAIAEEDYTTTSGTLHWGNGDLSPQTFRVPVADDGKIEGNEFFRLQLSQPSNRATLGQATAEVTILDNVSTQDAIAALQAVARNPVQKEIARVIGTLCQSGHASSDLQARCTELVVNASNNPTGVADALQQWAPEEYASLGRAGIEAGARQVNNVFSRLQSLRAGAVGIDAKNLSITVGGERIPLAALTDTSTDSAEYQLEGKPLEETADSELPMGIAHALGLYNLGLFINGHVGISERDETEREAGFELQRVGLTGGIDYRFSDRFVLGAAVGYAFSNADFAQDAGNFSNNLLTLGIYGTFYQPKRYYVDFIYSYGLGRFDVERNIQYQIGATAINQTASSTPDATQQMFGLSAGWHFQRNVFTFTPTFRLENIQLDIDDLSESMSAADQPGAELAVSLEKQSIKSTTLALGLQVAAELTQNSGKTLIPQLSMEWIRETQNKQRALRGHFRADSGRTQFVLLTDEPDTQYFSLGLGLALQMGKGKSAFIHYETLLGLENTTNHSITGGMRWEF